MILERIRSLRNSPKTAVIHNGIKYSYSEFYNQIVSVILHFKDLKKSDEKNLAVIVISNMHLCWVTLIALRYLGFDTIVINSADHLSKLGLKRIAHIILLSSEDHLKTFDHVDEKHRNKLHIISLERFHSKPDREIDAAPDRDATAGSGHILYTSGTTGDYKKVRVTSNAEDYFVNFVSETYRLSSDTVYNNIHFPAYTAAGYRMPLSIWHVGGCVVFRQTKALFKDFQDHLITFTFMTPSVLQDMLKYADENPIQYNPKLKVLTGGSVVSESLANTVTQRISPDLIVVYGSTETISTLLSNYKDVDDLIWLAPLKPDEFFILDDDGVECDLDQEGQLAVKLRVGDADHYFGERENYKNIFRNGYFYPGDLAIKRADGKIRITGRVADVLNINGWKVSVGPIETQIQTYLLVAHVCIFSTLTDDAKNLAVVAVETNRALSAHEMQAIAKYLQGFDDVIVKTLSAFPRTETAMKKINRRALREILLMAKTI